MSLIGIRLAYSLSWHPVWCQAKGAERAQVKQICSLVSVRSARLIAAAICGIIAHLAGALWMLEARWRRLTYT